eukprot:2294662-Rhodomonas_salina.3
MSAHAGRPRQMSKGSCSRCPWRAGGGGEKRGTVGMCLTRLQVLHLEITRLGVVIVLPPVSDIARVRTAQTITDAQDVNQRGTPLLVIRRCTSFVRLRPMRPHSSERTKRAVSMGYSTESASGGT